MPTSGYIKIKQWNQVEYSAGALTNIGANATGASVVGWIELSADESSTLTASRLGTIRFRGEWYQLGTTDGTSNQQFQIPSHGLSQYVAGIFVEKSVGSNTYEFWPSSGTGITLSHLTDKRAKICYMTTAGLVRIGHNGTTTAGYVPTSGLKVMIPNIILSCNTTAARTANALPNATLATRYDFTVTGAPTIEIDKITCTWYLSITQAYSLTITNSAVNESIAIAEIATPMTLTNFGVGQTAAQANIGLNISTCYAGGTLTDCVISRAVMTSTAAVEGLTDIYGFTFNNHKNIIIAARASAGSTISATRALSCTWNNPVLIGGKISLATCFDCEINGMSYIDSTVSKTTSSNAQYLVSVTAGSSNCNFNGPLDFLDTSISQPYNELFYYANSYDSKIRNLGTKDSPLDLGGTPVYEASWTRSSTTITVTSANHGMIVGTPFYVFISSNTSTITVSTKSVASVTDANTFTFTGLNAGSSSGTLSYVPTVSGLVSITACQRIKFQRIYAKNVRTLITADNSNKDIVLDNIQISGPMTGRITYAPTILYATIRGCRYLKDPGTGTAVYGTHWYDIFESDIPTGTLSGLSWTRSTTTATLTLTDHGYSTGQNFFVTASSNEAGIPLGYKSTLTALTKNTFTFTCKDSGTTSGTLTLKPICGEIILAMNEPISQTQSYYTVENGTPSFTSTGLLYMPTIDQQVLFECPYYILGHTGFPIQQIRMVNGGTVGNHDVWYSIDKNDGNGWSSFKNLNYNRSGGSGSSGQYTFTVTDATGVNVNDYVFGTGIRYGAKVTQINSNTITVDLTNTATVSGVITFVQLPNETGIDSSKGFKLKLRVKTIVTNTTGIGSINILTESTDASRKEQYPLDVVTLGFTGLQPGSEVRCYQGTDPSTATEIGGTESSGTTFSFTHSSGGQSGFIRIMNTGYIPISLPITYSSSDQSLLIQQTVDRNYI